MYNAQLQGFEKLSEVLKTMHDELAGPSTRAGIVAACQVYEQLYIQLLPEGTEYKLKPRIKKTVAYKVWRYPDESGYAGIVGTKSGMSPHAHLIEDGTKARLRDKYGIGGRFKYMMKKSVRNPNPKKIPTRLVLVHKPGWGIKPGTLMPGEPPTRTGVMPATHPLQLAAEMGKEKAQEAFENAFAQQFVKTMGG